MRTRVVITLAAASLLTVGCSSAVQTAARPSSAAPASTTTAVRRPGLHAEAHADLPGLTIPPLAAFGYVVDGHALYLSAPRARARAGGYRLVELRYPTLHVLRSVPTGEGTVVPNDGRGVWTVSAPRASAAGPGSVGIAVEHAPGTLRVVRRVRLAFGPAEAVIVGSVLVYAGGDALAAVSLPSGAALWHRALGAAGGDIRALAVSPRGRVLYDVLDTRAGATLESRSAATGQTIARRRGLVDGTVTASRRGVWFSTWRGKGYSVVRFFAGDRLVPGTRIRPADLGTDLLPVPDGNAVWLVPGVTLGPDELGCADARTGRLLHVWPAPTFWPTDPLPQHRLLGLTRRAVAVYAVRGCGQVRLGH